MDQQLSLLQAFLVYTRLERALKCGTLHTTAIHPTLGHEVLLLYFVGNQI